MKDFIKYIVVFLVSLFLLLEISIRVFGLAGHTIPTTNLNGDFLLKPNSEKTWVKGGLREIQAHYYINPQGWNSVLDYSIIDSNKTKVAIIGDSYIEGFQNDVENSIGRILENQMGHKIEVHEFGRSGGNIVDYAYLYQNVIKDNYDYTFILIRDDDLRSSTPGFMTRGDLNPKIDIKRKIYNNSHLIRYLNINHGVGEKLNALFSNGPESFQKISSKNKGKYELNFLSIINKKALQELDNKVVYIYEEGELNNDFLDWSDHVLLKINHKLMPKDHGFDEHWNTNGRINCATTMKEYINSKE